MEKNATTTTLAATNKPPHDDLEKKKRSVMHLIRAALFMLRGKNKKSNSLATTSSLTRLFGLVRPLHLPDNQQSLPALQLPPQATSMMRVKSVDDMSEISDRPALQEWSTPLHEGLSSSTAGDQMSRYASAMNLQELDVDDDNVYNEESDNDAYYDGIEGDKMIDVKAEQFIAQFYQQMKLQQLGTPHPRHDA
ncbi:hypothetical protein Ancab_020316 [Ancistrocladus abbreviatus]